jgi:DNA polymerase-3 subunit delta
MKKLNKQILLLLGEEDFLAREHLAQIKSAYLQNEDFNWHVYDSNEQSFNQFLQGLSDFPFLAQYRLAYISDLSALKAKDSELLIEYLEKPIESAWLIIRARKLDNRKKLDKLIKSSAKLYDCETLDQIKTKAWIQKQFAFENKKISPDAINLIIDCLGSNLSLIKNSIEQIVLFNDKSETIGFDAVENLLSPIKSEDVFAMIDAIIAGNKTALEIQLKNFFSSGQSIYQLLALLLRQFNILLLIKFQGAQALQGLYYLPSFALDQYRKRIQQLGESLNYQLIQNLYSLEKRVKMFSLDERQQVILLSHLFDAELCD